MSIASLFGVIKQAAPDRARTTIRVADESSNTGCRDATLVDMISWALNGKRGAAGRCKLLQGELGCGKYLESTGCIDGGSRGRTSGGEGGGADGGGDGDDSAGE